MFVGVGGCANSPVLGTKCFEEGGEGWLGSRQGSKGSSGDGRV